ncbi:hypothetical protein [Butyrivibrio sp. LB2008]|uniref:hypothetical protein n=1 Tax=Butyrivibrio sp. LB2008 TaxID=1408305 RepID=UPI00047A4395|nr:hypothetical protein [Butyrivibrio sp. LB2008]
MTDNIRITLRQKLWWFNFGLFLFFFIIMGYWFIEALLDENKTNPVAGPIVTSIFLSAIFLLMVSYTYKVTVTDKKIEVEKLFIFKRVYLVEDIDRVVELQLRAKSACYSGIDIYVKGKKIRLIRKISEIWNNYDELLLFLRKKKIPMVREQQ